MKLSTRSRYAVRALAMLASEFGSGPIMLQKIAEAEKLPESYLEQLLMHLRRGGIVKSSRGAKGGYELTKPPEDIFIGEIIELLDGKIDLANCASIPNCSGTTQNCECMLKHILDEASIAVARVFYNKSLKDVSCKNKYS
ncbi:MAG: Rrf2 family transcriptional regulator [Armatimonadota bacterium]